MQRKNQNSVKYNVAQIIAICQKSIANYNSLCSGFMGEPNTEAINRKISFLQIVSRLNDVTPNEAFVAIYNFYMKETKSRGSRLIQQIQSDLMAFVGVHIRSGSDRSYGLRLAEALEDMHKIAYTIKEELGLICDNDETPMNTLRRRSSSESL